MAQKAVPGTWIRGRGYNEFYLAEKRHPTRWDLDEVAPNHHVKLTHRSGHAHVLNSLALQAVNISMETPDPEGGLIDRDINPTSALY
jgi:predicted amidohydrolase YtcJ